MLFNTVIDLVHGVAGKTVAAAVRHGIGIGTVTVDTGKHGFVPEVLLDVFFQCGMAGKAISGTGKKCRRQKNKSSYDLFHTEIILSYGEQKEKYHLLLVLAMRISNYLLRFNQPGFEQPKKRTEGNQCIDHFYSFLFFSLLHY